MYCYTVSTIVWDRMIIAMPIIQQVFLEVKLALVIPG
jgi:hypothetical protein